MDGVLIFGSGIAVNVGVVIFGGFFGKQQPVLFLSGTSGDVGYLFLDTGHIIGRCRNDI